MYKHIRSCHNIKGPKESYPQWILDKCQYRVVPSEEAAALSESYYGVTIESKPFNTTISGTPQSVDSDVLVLPGKKRIAQKRSTSSRQLISDYKSEYELPSSNTKRTRLSAAATLHGDR
jgi:hypothetical protein